jgi:cob(I)alamin adenosyltransferase
MSSDDKFRISRVVTRTGDGGDTGLADGRRVRKSHARIEALGSVDELNAHLGLLGAQLPEGSDMTADVRWLQNRLFDLGAAIAVGSPPRSLAVFVAELDELVARRSAALPPLREFVLPAGPVAAVQAHVARTVCRRAERDLVALADAEPDAVDGSWQQFVNRLSDGLFVMARELARAAGPEIGWEPAKG